MKWKTLLFLLLPPLMAWGQKDKDKGKAIQSLGTKQAHYTDVAKQIWGFAEMGVFMLFHNISIIPGIYLLSRDSYLKLFFNHMCIAA